MLHHPRMKTVGVAADPVAVLIKPFVMNPCPARHHAAHAWHRQTTFPVRLDFIRQRRDDRIDQHRLGNRRGFGIAHVALEAEDHQLPVDADLGRRETRAVGGVHGVEHVGDQCVHRKGTEFRDRFCLAQQARVAHAQNFVHAHRYCFKNSVNAGPVSGCFEPIATIAFK